MPLCRWEVLVLILHTLLASEFEEGKESYAAQFPCTFAAGLEGESTPTSLVKMQAPFRLKDDFYTNVLDLRDASPFQARK